MAYDDVRLRLESPGSLAAREYRLHDGRVELADKKRIWRMRLKAIGSSLRLNSSAITCGTVRWCLTGFSVVSAGDACFRYVSLKILTNGRQHALKNMPICRPCEQTISTDFVSHFVEPAFLFS